MKRKPFVLVAFLLCLYVIPTFVSAASWNEITSADMEFDTPDWYEAAIAELEFLTPEPPSDQSITGFEETLPDDTMYYPDSFDNGTIELADYGEDWEENYDPNYVKTHVLDNDAFEEVGPDIEIWFEVDTTEWFEGFTYSHYLYASSQTDCDLTAYNFDTDLFTKIDEPLPESYDWMNGTIYDSNYWNTTHIAFQLNELAGSANFYWDYAQVTTIRMTLTDSDQYAESFADVSDWTNEDVTFTSNGDIGTVSSPTSWDSGLNDFPYRKLHAITGSSGASTDYQIRLNVTRAVGSDSGDTVYVSTKCQADFDDIRFTDNDGDTELDYWLQESTAAYAIFWIEVKDNLDSNQEIYIYYGNNTVSTTSNGANTFPTLFDNFDGSAEPPATWSETQIGTLTWSDVQENSYYKVYNFEDSSAEWHGNEIYKVASVPTTFAVVAKIDVTCGVENKNQHNSLLQGYFSSGGKFSIGYSDGLVGDIGGIVSSITGTTENEAVGTRIGGTFTFEIRRDGTDITTYWNDNLQQTKTESDTIDEVRFTVTSGAVSSSSNPQSEIEYVFCRKYISTEPTHSAWGSEETYDGAGRTYEEIATSDFQNYYYSFYAFTATNTAMQYYSGSTWYNLSSSFSTTGHYFGIITDTEATNITRVGAIVSGTVGLDYLRISKANEAGGWGHDCSTIFGTDAASSDGDNITVSSAVTWEIDTTSNKSIIDKDHFPFMEVRVGSGTGSITIDTYDGSGWDSVLSTTPVELKTYRFNINAVDNIQKIRLTPTVSFIVSFLNLNSIANWSYYAPSATVDDYFYTDAGILYSEKSSNESQQLTYDIELSSNTTIFEFANISTSVWTGDGAYSYGLDYDVGDGWEGYTYDETIVALVAGTLEAIRIIVRDSGAISAISFTDPLSLWWEAALAELIFRVKDWMNVAIAILRLLVELYQFGGYFILAGLVMIPVSTLFLVRGGKDDMSRDKLFLFFLIFLFGWALVLGGIL